MKPRLLILIAVAAGLGMYFANKAAAPSERRDDGPDIDLAVDGYSEDKMRDTQKLLEERPLPGEEPDEDAEIDIRVEVDPSGEKNRLLYYMTESHGYYVETLQILFYYKPTPDTEYEDSPYVMQQFANDYIPANETQRSCFDLVPSDMRNIDEDMGTSANWGAIVDTYGRAREKNPEPLPVVDLHNKCR